MPTHEPGQQHSAKIVKTSIREIGQKDAVEVKCELPSGEIVAALIFLTSRAANMARAQLKACGFDVDMQSLATLAVEETMLAGNFVDLESEEYNGKIQWRLRTGTPVPQSRLFDHDAMLRAAKNHDAMLRAAKNRDEATPAAAQTRLIDDDIPF